MVGQAGFWDIEARYVRLSAAGDPLEKLNAVVAWEVFRKPLAKALKRSGCSGSTLRRLGRLRLCSPASTVTSPTPVISRWAGKSSTRRSWRHRNRSHGQVDSDLLYDRVVSSTTHYGDDHACYS